MQNCNYFCTNLIVEAPGVVWLTGYFLDRAGLGNVVPDTPSLLPSRMKVTRWQCSHQNKILSVSYTAVLTFITERYVILQYYLGMWKWSEKIHCHQTVAGDYFCFVVAPFLHVKSFAKAWFMEWTQAEPVWLSWMWGEWTPASSVPSPISAAAPRAPGSKTLLFGHHWVVRDSCFWLLLERSLGSFSLCFEYLASKL